MVSLTGFISPDVRPALEKGTTDPDPGVRQAAASTLGLYTLKLRLRAPPKQASSHD